MKQALWPLLLLALLLPAGLAHGQGLGTLFTTPQEREYLDYLRQEFLQRTRESGFDIGELPPGIPLDDAEAAETREFHLGGVFHSNDGSRTLWLNRQPLAEADLPSHIRVVTREGVEMLNIRTAEASYLLKPGQMLNLDTGVIRDGLAANTAAAESAGVQAVQGGAAPPSADPQQQAQPGEGVEQTDSRAEQLRALLDALDALGVQ